MKNLGMFLTQVAVVVGALAIYHVLFHAGERGGAGGGETALEGGGLTERVEIERILLAAEGLGLETYDEGPLRTMLRDAALELTPEQEQKILPLLHEHLTRLRANLDEAHQAVVRGAPASARAKYHARAVRIHGELQASLREIISRQAAAKLYMAMPPMIPPVPGSTNPPPTPRKEPPPPVHVQPPGDDEGK